MLRVITPMADSGYGLLLAACLLAPAVAGESDNPGPPEPPAIASAFRSTTVECHPLPGGPAVAVKWHFVNHWDFPLAIERIDQSCSCLHADASEHQPVPPGKSGTINASFVPGVHRGTLRKSIHVRIVGHSQPVELIATAEIPHSVVISTQQISWTPEQPAATHTIELSAGTTTDIHITDVRGLQPRHYNHHVETTGPGRKHRIHITPRPGASNATLQIHTDSPDPRDRVFAVFLRPAPEPQANP